MTETTPHKWVVLEEAGKDCPDHGPYLSTHLELEGSEAPEDLRQHWTNCPACNSIWEAQAIAREREANFGALRKEELQIERQQVAGIPKLFADSTLHNWQHEMPKQRVIWNWAKGYCHDFNSIDFLEGQGVVHRPTSAAMIGHPGTGKTHLAIGILMHVLNNGRSGKYTTVMRMLSSIKNTYHRDSKVTEESVIKELCTVDLLVIDEVGKQLDTKYETAQLFRIIDTRYSEMLPTIFVSNLDRKALTDFLGPAVMDRLADNGGKVLSFDWGSYRGRKK